MRRVMLMSSAAVVALVVAIPMAVSAVSAGTIPGDSALDQPVLEAVRRIEPIRLNCEPRSTDADAAVSCKWSEPLSDRAAAIKLFRYDRTVDPNRTVIHRSENLAETSFTDTQVREGHRYGYAVQVYDVNGRVVGRSSAVWVSVPRVTDHAVEVLKLACGLGDSGEWIACEWSRPVSRDAAVVSLWRSVDGGQRELVEQFRPQGPNVYRDAVPDGASQVTYAVIATTEADRVVGRSRPVTVRIPEIGVRPVDTRPVDTRPVDTRPVDTRPVDVARWILVRWGLLRPDEGFRDRPASTGGERHVVGGTRRRGTRRSRSRRARTVRGAVPPSCSRCSPFHPPKDRSRHARRRSHRPDIRTLLESPARLPAAR